MPRFVRFASFRRSAPWVLAIGLFAMALQAMGGSGLMPRVAGGGFEVEICTSKGVGKVATAAQSGGTSLPDAGHHDCCTLCSAGAPLLPSDATPGVPPAPTFRGGPVAVPFPWPAAPAWLSHPPRGPPQS